jgi:hypothetical protein
MKRLKVILGLLIMLTAYAAADGYLVMPNSPNCSFQRIGDDSYDCMFLMEPINCWCGFYILETPND